MKNEKQDILQKKHLKKHLLFDIEELETFVEKRDNYFLVFVEKIEDLYKKSDNILNDINLLFKNKSYKNIAISLIPFSEINELLPIEVSSKEPKVIEVKNNEIINILNIYDFEKLISLFEINELLVEKIEDLNDIIYGNNSNILLLFTDNLEELSELLPEPKKNISQLYQHFFKINVSDLDLFVLYSSKEDINKLLYSNDTHEIPLPIVFKVDKTGTFSFPIQIKRIKQKINEVNLMEKTKIDFTQVLEHYEEILKDIQLEKKK